MLKTTLMPKNTQKGPFSGIKSARSPLDISVSSYEFNS